MNNEIKICIAGIDGYVGKMLVKLVASHPHLKLIGVLGKNPACHSDTKDEWGIEKDIPMYSVNEVASIESEIDVLILATPPEASISLVARLKACEFNIIDLSGAFRLPQDELYQWYGIKHDIPGLLSGAPYGLSPWGYKDYDNLTIIANPGCYANCALVSLIPLLQENIIKSDNIIIDAKSGTSGAGKKSKFDLMFSEMSENFFPYKVGKHQHIPEIKNALLQYTNKLCDITLVTHMLPLICGISMSIYADTNSDFKSDNEIAKAIKKAYQSAYVDYHLIQFGEINQNNLVRDKYLLSLKNVVGTPNAHIAYFIDDGKVRIFSCIDNLLKGAASQAIENINKIYDLPFETGLKNMEGIL